MNLNERLNVEIDEIVCIGERLARDSAQSGRDLGPERIEELSSIATRGGQLIVRLYGKGSHYEERLKSVLREPNFVYIHSKHHRHVSELVGIFKGVKHDLVSGLLNDMRQLIRAEVFSDFLEMSEYLLGEGYKDAAAVMVGAVLEDALRKIANNHSVPITGRNGKPFSIDPLNVALAKAGIYNALVQKQVTSFADLRNKAAHAKYSEYDEEQVKQSLQFVAKFCADYLT
jgi:hypothetical protein